MDPPTGGEGDEEEREDELPTVVELEKGDVGEEEYKKFCEAMKEMSRCHIDVCNILFDVSQCFYVMAQLRWLGALTSV